MSHGFGKYLVKALLLCLTLLLVMSGTPALSQQTEEEAQVEEIIVTGIRSSIQQSLEAKREADQVKDVISAEDIGKLPDQNVAEALQRITGIQIGRDFGEGNSIQVRGLPQIRIELNGQTLVGSGSESRGVQFNELAPDAFKSLEVVKSPTADQTEGALGATINLISRRPFDSKGLVFSGRFGLEHNEDEEANSPIGSVFFSNRMETGLGDMGISLSLNHSDKDIRRDTNEVRWILNEYTAGGTQYPYVQGTGIDTDTYVPQQLREQYWAREQRRESITGSFQWRPSEALEIIVDGNYNDFNIRTLSTILGARPTLRNANLGRAGGVVADNPVLSTDGSTLLAADVAQGTLFNSGWDQRSARTTQGLAASFTYDQEKWVLSGNLSNSKGEALIDNIFFNINQSTPNPQMSYEVGGSDLPTASLSRGGVPLDLADRSTYRIHSVRVQKRDQDSENTEFKLDFDYHLDSNHLSSLETGVRVAERTARRQNLDQNNTFQGNNRNRMTFDGNLSLANHPEIPVAGTPSNFLEDFSGGVRDYINIDAQSFFDDTQLLEDTFGFDRTAVIEDLNAFYDISEETSAIYLKANFDGELGKLPYVANIGARYINTDLVSAGYQTSTSGAPMPVETDADYDDLLLSGNIRLAVSDDLYLRLAAANVMSRPNLTQLSSAIRLNVGSDTGASGNPELEPFRADQFDISLEWYLSDTDFISAALFYKDVESFIATVVEPVLVNEPARDPPQRFYDITRPVNGEGGKVQGLEIGFSKFFDFLPSPFDGLGLSVNYTYADSETPNDHPVTGESLPLEDLSEDSYNVIAFYEKDDISARLAYNWRSEFLDQTFSLNAQPQFEKERGQLDFSISYTPTPKTRVTFEAINLNDSYIERYLSIEERQSYISTSGRRFVLSLSARL